MIGALVAKKALADSFDALNRHDLPKVHGGLAR